MCDDFGVGICAKDVTAAGETVAELEVIVDLSVEHDLHAAVLAGDWLPAAGHVDDAQAPHPETDGIADEETLIIGAAVDERVGHPLRDRPDLGRRPLRRDESSYAAHSCFLIKTSR